ncbi:MAG: GNAT family N-acetyltransferase, partial [bacterium]
MTHAIVESISFRDLVTLEEMEAAVDLQAEIWGYGQDDRDHPYPSRALFSLSESGGLVSGAFSEGKLVGFAVAWLGRRQSSGAYYLHSQLLGVLPQYRRSGIGFNLKLRQRDFALSCGLPLVRWTFDPLQSANAFFNLHLLGAVVESYSENHYGAIRSHLARTLPSDRLLANWYVNTPRVESRLSKKKPSCWEDLPAALRSFQENRGDIALPRPEIRSLRMRDKELLVEIPIDFEKILDSTPELGREWHQAIRNVLTAYLSRSYLIDDFLLISEGDRRLAFYHLARKERQDVLKLEAQENRII